MSIYTESLDELSFPLWNKDRIRKSKKISCDPTKHYPNKAEASLLRRLMSENGLTEEKVRAVKKYRILLSEAQKKGEIRLVNGAVKWYRSKIKRACRITGLVPQHPETIKVLDEILNDSYYDWGRPYYYRDKPNAITIVKRYAKK